MRSSTIFLVFGGLMLVILLFAYLNRYSNAQSPVTKTSQEFLQALNKQDLATVQRLVDPQSGTVIDTAGQVIGINFTATKLEGAFTKRPEEQWGYAELLKLQIDPEVESIIADNLATVKCVNDIKIYLRQHEGAWKVFYIERNASTKK